MTDTNYYTPYNGVLFEKLYKGYLTKLEGKHLSTHQPMISKLYRSLYLEEEFGQEFESLLFHFFAISNACDDIIDEAPISNRKETIANIATVFVSFFIFFEKLVETFLGRNSVLATIFDSWHINLPVVLEAPYIELNPPIDLSKTEIPNILVLVLKNRCVDHQFLCHFLDKAFKQKSSDKNLNSSYNLEKVVVLIKTLEFLVKDLSIDEIKQDISSNAFNILIYLHSLLRSMSGRPISHEMYRTSLTKTKELIYNEFRNACLQIPERTRLVASEFFYEQEELFVERIKRLDTYITLFEKE